jgi:hypothetical protein
MSLSGDYRVGRRSDFEIRQVAKRARGYFGISKQHRVDVIACLNCNVIWTVTGQKRLNFQVRPDLEMGEIDGSTINAKGIVTIAVKQSVHDAALTHGHSDVSRWLGSDREWRSY